MRIVDYDELNAIDVDVAVHYWVGHWAGRMADLDEQALARHTNGIGSL